jgi:predicted HTH domain antitoxin
MGSILLQQLLKHPDRLLSEAKEGEVALVTQDGEPTLLALPPSKGRDSPAAKLELAVALFDRAHVSLGMAAQIARLAYGEMVDELGRRGIAVTRLAPGELCRELAALGD